MATDKPYHIVVVGAGEFGLSTALALLSRPTYSRSRITILERSHTLPNPVGSSVDASRIIRTDYASKPYVVLASEAQRHWRDQTDGGWGGQGRYTESGFVLTANDDKCLAYVSEALQNVRRVATIDKTLDINKIEPLDSEQAIRKATGYNDGSPGHKGYANWNSGWAHATKVVSFAVQQIRDIGRDRVQIRTGAYVTSLIVDRDTKRCRGVILDRTRAVEGNHDDDDDDERKEEERIEADLTILAAGAWTPSLIDLEGRCVATGQALAYVKISEEEEREIGSRPVVMNFSTGMFVIPPTGGELKVAQHAFGYRNPQTVRFSSHAERVDDDDDRSANADDRNGTGEQTRTATAATAATSTVTKQVSVPRTGIPVPQDDQVALRSALSTLLPSMAGRPFTHTRLCWYCDTPSGDFLVDYHPDHPGLFVATGGSGHGFKFFPVLGEKIVDRMETILDLELTRLWRWREKVHHFTSCDDGSRCGQRELVLKST